MNLPRTNISNVFADLFDEGSEIYVKPAADCKIATDGVSLCWNRLAAVEILIGYTIRAQSL